MRLLLPVALLPFAVVLIAPGLPLAAQACPGGDTFWQRDLLPAQPAGLTAVSVIRGVCEGESAGVVFEMPAGMPPQRLTQVVAPWGAIGGTNGFQAQLDVLVYDGVSFAGGIPSMGTLVFQLSTVSASGMLAQSHTLNTFDMSPYTAIVGTAPPNGSPLVRRFAVCFRVDVNAYPSTCAQGYNANFFTDNPSFSLTCNTPLRTSLIEIQGQGWRDASVATQGGIPLCPIFYNGTWCIRACSRDAFPASYTTFGPGCPGTLGITHLIPATLPRLGTNLFVVVDNLPLNLALMITGFSNTVWGPIPLPLDVSGFGLPGCTLRVSFDITTGLTGGGSSASFLLPIPNQATLLGVQLHQQAFVLDPVNTFGGVLSDAATMTVGN